MFGAHIQTCMCANCPKYANSRRGSDVKVYGCIAFIFKSHCAPHFICFGSNSSPNDVSRTPLSGFETRQITTNPDKPDNSTNMHVLVQEGRCAVGRQEGEGLCLALRFSCHSRQDAPEGGSIPIVPNPGKFPGGGSNGAHKRTHMCLHVHLYAHACFPA